MTTAAPSVSVIIPAYNASAFIERTLETVRAQTYVDYEIIVVDDGSVDDTQAVAAEYLSRHGLAGRCIRQPNKKVASARNAGMYAAKGAFIALLDSDDLWYPNKLEAVLGEFKRHPDIDLICHHENIICHGHVARVLRHGPLSSQMYERLLYEGNILSPSATVFKKAVALSIGGFCEDPNFDTAEDYDFWLRMCRVARFQFLDAVLGEYQVWEGRATRRIEYHYTHLENVIRAHFMASFDKCASVFDQLRMRRRLAMVYRAAAGELMAYRESPEKQRIYVFKMLRAFPFSPKSLARALIWVAQWARARA